MPSRRMNYKPRTTYRQKYVPRPVKQYVQKALDRNTENKYKVLNMVTQYGTVTSTWNEAGLNTIAQGVAKEQRIGNKIRIKSLEIKGCISSGANELLTDDAYNVLRVILGLYRGSSVTPLATSGRGLNDPLRTDYLSANGLLIKKYMDKYITLPVTGTEQGAGDGYTPSVKNFTYYKRWKKGILIQWSNDTTNYPSANLVLSMISDSIAVTNPGFVAGYAVMTYEDA